MVSPRNLFKRKNALGIPLLLLLLLLSRFSRVRLCATPWTAAHQAPPSLGFSRQEHWSGLPFPSPMHPHMLSRFSCVQLCDPTDDSHQAPPSTGFFRQEYCSGLPFPYPGLWSIGSQRVRHDRGTSLSLFTVMHWRRKWHPLQCSCLENPMDGGAWWAAVHGVLKSQT